MSNTQWIGRCRKCGSQLDDHLIANLPEPQCVGKGWITDQPIYTAAYPKPQPSPQEP